MKKGIGKGKRRVPKGKGVRTNKSRNPAVKKSRTRDDEERKPFIISYVLIIVIIVVLAAVGWYLLKVGTPDGDGSGIDRSIKFPRDEGAHDETHEFWRVVFHLESSGSERFGISCKYTKYSESFGGGSVRQILITDESNVTGKDYNIKRDMGDITAGEGRMDIFYDSGFDEEDVWYEDEM
ncbi:MAG: hypothetical protein KAI64_06800, partial [Thermoplasmata archaeon]|nr:hypothetical protein [Thermoplasmata archaeon]